MYTADILSSVSRAIQLTMVNQLWTFLLHVIPSMLHRVLVLLVTCVLYMAFNKKYVTNKVNRTDSMTMDLILAITTREFIEVSSITGASTLIMKLSQHICLLILCSVVRHCLPAMYATTFVENAKFLVTQTISDTFTAYSSPNIAFVEALLLAFGGRLLFPSEQLLIPSLVVVPIDILNDIVLESIPVTMTIPTLVAGLSCIRPLQNKNMYTSNLHTFLVFNTANAVAAALIQISSPATAPLLAICLCIISPVQSLREVCKIALVNTFTSYVLSAVILWTKADIYLGLFCALLLFKSMLRILTHIHREEPDDT